MHHRVRSSAFPHALSRTTFLRSVLTGLAALAGFTPAARAQSYLHWDLNGFTAGSGGGTAPTGLWNATDARWCIVADGAGPVVPWINNSIAVFAAGTNATGAYAVTLTAANLPIGGLQFQEGTTTLTGVGTLQLVNPVAGLTPQVALNGQPTAIGAGVTLAGSAGLNFVGSGTLTLAGATTTTGATMIDGVTVKLAAANRLSDASPLQLLGTLDLAGFDETVGALSGSGAVALGSGRLTVQNPTDSIFTGTITGTGSVWKSGAGRLTLTERAAWTGATRIQAGTLATGFPSVLSYTSDLIIDAGATFDIGNGVQVVGTITGAGTVALNSGVLVLGNETPFTFDGLVEGTGSIAKWGGATMTLTKPSPFSGTTSIMQGTLRAACDYALDYPRMRIEDVAALDLDGHLMRIQLPESDGTIRLRGGRLEFSGAGYCSVGFVGPGTLVKTGTATSNLYSTFGPVGTFEIQEGTVCLLLDDRLGAGVDVQVAPGAMLRVNAAQETVGKLTAGGEVVVSGGRLTVAGAGPSTVSGAIVGDGQIAKSGAGTLTLQGASTYTGATNIFEGTVRLTGTNRLPVGAFASVAAGASFELAGPPEGASQQLSYVSGAGDLRAVGPNDTWSLGWGNYTTTFDGRLRGAGNFQKTGTGTLTLTGASDGTGDLAVFLGTLRVGADDSLPSRTSGTVSLGGGGRIELAGHTQRLHGLQFDGLVELGGGRLILTGGALFEGTVAGPGSLEKEGAATDTLRGPLNFSGPTRVRAGTLRIDRSGTLDTDVQIDAGATLDPSGRVVAVDELTGAGTLACAAGEFGAGAGGTDFSFGGAITGDAAARFTKNGAGRFTLTGTTGVGVEIRGGTLGLGADERIGNLASVHVAAGAYFDVAGRTETIDALTGPGKVSLGTGRLTVGAGGGSFTFDGTVTDGARFTKTGAGEFVLAGRLAGADSVLLQSGTLRLGADDRFDSTLDLAMNNGATFDLGGFSQTLREIEGFGDVHLPAGSTLTLDPGAMATALAVDCTGDGRFVKRGAETLTWQGTSADALELAVEGGGVRLGGGQRFAPATKLTLGAGAWFESGAFAQDFGELAGPGELRVGAGGVVRASQGTFDGTLTGPGTFDKTGATSLTLAQPQSFPGTLRAMNGTLGLGAGAWTFGGTFVAKGGVLTLLAGSTLAGPVELNGSIQLGGGGPVVALTGAVTGHGGFHGNVSLGGSFAPGSDADPYALIGCSGSMKFSSAQTLTLQLGGYAPGLSHDQIVCGGTVTFGGTLRIERHHGFAIVAGQPFQVFQAGGFAGAFAALDLPVLPPGYAWDPTRLNLNGTLRIVAGYDAWVLGFGLNPATDGAPLANPTGDGVANLLKYLFRGNPLVAQRDLAPVATVEPNAGGATLVFSYRRDALAALTLAAVGVEWSTDLATWAPVTDGAGGARVTVTPIDTNLDLVTVRIPIGGPRGFARLRVEL